MQLPLKKNNNNNCQQEKTGWENQGNLKRVSEELKFSIEFFSTILHCHQIYSQLLRCSTAMGSRSLV